MAKKVKAKQDLKKEKTSTSKQEQNNQSAKNKADSPPSNQTQISYQPKDQQQRLPPAFPRTEGIVLPESGFLRNEGKFKKAFQVALDTAYEGFVWETPGQGTNDLFPHDEIQQSLLAMDAAGLFRTDVTQPFGLGTKCAKTYVTRCLLGDEGTTYKYLGVRMFSHPWNGNGVVENPTLRKAIETIGRLNGSVTQRTKIHLRELEEKRLHRGVPPPTVKGEPSFDVALINKMVSTSDLKAEPMFGTEKCSVSWHADSSLEHYSSIAVYHTIIKKNSDHGEPKPNTTSVNRDWSVALRVVHNAEGPSASKRGADISSSVKTDSPPISVSLSSGSVYYLLDDHNHHHQHAVLAPKEGDPGVRFSSTHRLLREAHTVKSILGRCASVCSDFHRKGPKVWRAEQLLLNEIEFEWLRQFYIQGEGHKKLLWQSWEKHISALLRYWSMLETRTLQVVNTLKLAVEGHCGISCTDEESKLPRERKLRRGRKKALAAVEGILSRGSDGPVSPKELLYDNVASLISERASLREMWSNRENDAVFKRMGAEYQPIPFPAIFNFIGDISKVPDGVGRSPLSGSAEFLMEVAKGLEALGDCYESKDLSGLPTNDSLARVTETVLEGQREADKGPLAHDASSCRQLTENSNGELDLGSLGVGNSNRFGGIKKKGRKKSHHNQGRSEQAKKKRKR